MSMSSMRMDSTCRPQARVSFSTWEPMAASICSRSARSSSRVIWPTTSRSEVWAYCEIAKRKSCTRTTARAASATRKNNTPSMVTGTLSRVITCWRVDLQGLHAGVDRAHPVDQRDDQEEPRPLDPMELAQPEHHRALPLRGQADGGGDERVGQGPERECREGHGWGAAQGPGDEQPGDQEHDEHDRRDVVDHHRLSSERRGRGGSALRPEWKLRPGRGGGYGGLRAHGTSNCRRG